MSCYDPYDPTDFSKVGMPRINPDYRPSWRATVVLAVVFVFFTSVFWLSLLGILWTVIVRA